MNIINVETITRQAVAQALGEPYMTENGYLTAIPAEKLVDVGKDVSNGINATVEIYTKACLTLLAKHIIDEGEIATLYDDILVDRVEWGGFIENSIIDFADIMDDPVLQISDGVDFSSVEHTFYAPKVQTKVYDEGKGICVPISIQRTMLTEAFNNYESMNAYLSKIRAKVKLTMKKALDRYCGVLVEAGIATSVLGTQTAVYLLDDAYADGVTGITTTTTPEEALMNEDYLVYTARRMSEIRSNMKVDTCAYNDGSWAVATPNANLYLNTHFSRALQFGIFANTYHKEDVKFGEYKEIPMWQSSATSTDNKFPYSACTSIMFSADNTNKLGLGTSAITIENVIGFMFNPKAIGVCMFKEYMTSSYTASADFWNEFLHVLVNQLLNTAYPMVAFINGRAS